VAEGVRGLVAAVVRPARAAAAAAATREPNRAAFLPLVVLGGLGVVEMFTPGFPFATVGLLLLAAFAALALMSRPVTMTGVVLAWALFAACGWRAEAVAGDSPVWLDVLVYLASLAALRSAYVAARGLSADAAQAAAPGQARACRLASRAIGVALIAQCAVLALWSAANDVNAAVIFGELLLVGAGVALALAVRSGQYMRTAQTVLTFAALGAVVLLIAAQLSAFAAGQAFTVTSIGAGVLLLLMSAALVIMIHTREQVEQVNG
jgi:hypothetical protein